MKSEARNIAVNYLCDAADSVYSILGKVCIDDKGTQSEDGYSVSDLDAIKKELDFLVKKILKYKL